MSRPCRLRVPDEELQWSAMRAQGAGGQNVNKVSSAVQLRWDIAASSLPEPVRQRLLEMNDRRITREGVLVIKAQTQRSQPQNRAQALERLHELLARAAEPVRERVATRPTAASRRRRLDDKARRSQLKARRSQAGD
jgi:ribosome-associated protein